MTEVSSLTGRLLVATPALADPNFDRAVVLLLDHDEEGSLGVILNRPTPVGVADILAPWAALAGEPGVVFQGGPVSLDSALGVAVVPGALSGEGGVSSVDGGGRPDGDGDGDGGAGQGGEGTAAGVHPADPGAVQSGEEPLGWRRVHGAIGLVDLEAPPELLAAVLGSLRIFAGYAGWGPGQLEDELVEGAWYVVESEPGDVSSPDPEQLWRAVLRRQRNELAMVATYPDDPSLN
ncbi:YqgE/AlgH family protein [Streptomyces sp. NBRC 110611]|uniref:YqgE/AlgH family protein n=1 Tax=Streptomyces sp. NBRC 110611 TaxID=1621259 RepID=UPI0008376998|nr:YqgE/AlgH family protein [Streptomyces sp. NBRC 110611]